MTGKRKSPRLYRLRARTSLSATETAALARYFAYKFGARTALSANWLAASLGTPTIGSWRAASARCPPSPLACLVLQQATALRRHARCMTAFRTVVCKELNNSISFFQRHSGMPSIWLHKGRREDAPIYEYNVLCERLPTYAIVLLILIVACFQLEYAKRRKYE